MAVKMYNKLVRDKIPTIIEQEGKKCNVSVLDDKEYLKALDTKLDEELAEYHKDQNVEELADLLEVLYAVSEARGFTKDELEAVRIRKAEKRGQFKEKLFLESVIE
jgi:predicted house-cleaning noncanonical NTP pyrophosphatase (MazG superfamily)